MCMICGHVGCGRYHGGHAFEHFQATQHAYAMELATQSVWDYVGDGYVHRILQNMSDGKLVEAPSSGDTKDTKDTKEKANVDMDMLQAQFDSKLEAVASEYNYLMARQLESQRRYYEGRLSQMNGVMTRRESDFAKETADAKGEMDRMSHQLRELHCKHVALEERYNAQAEQNKKMLEDYRFMKEVNGSLERNALIWKEAAEKNASQHEETKKALGQKIRELEEEVHDLRFFVESREKLETLPEEEAKEGTLVVEAGPVPPTAREKLRAKRLAARQHGR